MDIIESVVVPRQSGAVVRVPEGAALKITDLEGQQVSDMFAVFTDLSDFLGARTSRGANWRLFPEVGGRFISNNYRPMSCLRKTTRQGYMTCWHRLVPARCTSALDLRATTRAAATTSGRLPNRLDGDQRSSRILSTGFRTHPWTPRGIFRRRPH